ncbi:MAG: nucleotidyltransferase domain-containing protein [Lentisphaerae bacterium]|nr:nucleotidyltransferase domain-containing protein [Lentisphaerota bacterium]
MRQIKAVGKKIGERFQPRRIILFGSYAEGRATPDSDVDMLIEMPFKGSPVDQSVEIRMQIRPPFPVDFLVRTSAAIRKRLSLGDPFIRSILTRGKVIYEADHTRMD